MTLFRPIPFVVWNLFLALIPVALSFFITRGIRGQWRARGRVTWLVWIPLLIVWLAFLSNTCYLLTEWRHYLESITATQLFFQAMNNREAMFNLFLETGFYLFYSGCGLLTFFLAVWPLDRLARRRMGRWIWPVQASIFSLCSLGVYLGLVHRFNSWDLLSLPRLLDVLHTLSDAMLSPVLRVLIVGFGVILWLLYFLFDIWMDGAAWRLHMRRERIDPPLDPSPDDPAPEEVWQHASL